jgi:predicted double-glycine peptidase
MVTTNDRQETFILDPAKDYALIRYSAIDAAGTMRLHNYGNYQSVGDNWCPTSILIEKYETTTTPHKLTARDIWAFTAVSGATPSDAGFDVTYEYDAYVEDFSLDGEPLRYRYSQPQPPTAKRVDTDDIIKSRLMIVSDDQSTNCATAAINYIAAHFGKNATLTHLTQALAGRDTDTSLLALQRAAENIGLYTKAVQTDIAALKDLTNCKVILHLPKINHFVVLGDIDEKYIRLIDLTSNRCYYRQSIEYFNSTWEGTAFLLSNEPIADAPRRFAQIDPSALPKVTAGADCEQCNNSCSDAGASQCIAVGGICLGSHTILYSRVCCGNASSGTCSASSLIYKNEETCGWDVNADCTGEGDWTSYYMQACG